LALIRNCPGLGIAIAFIAQQSGCKTTDAKTEENQRMNAVTERVADRELERRVLNFLQGWQRPGLRNVEVEAAGGTVTLRGTVNSFYEKQLSQQCCRRVAGVLKLIDAVSVTAHRCPTPALN
jgi:osmotically-inducible protein OsmY